MSMSFDARVLYGTVKTFAEPTAKCEVLETVPKKWQTTGDPGGFQLAYEPRNGPSGQSLKLLGELHQMNGAVVLVKYDGEMQAELDDWWVPHDASWLPPMTSDRDAKQLRLKCDREAFLKAHPEVRKMENLLRRVDKGSKTGKVELCQISQKVLDEYRDSVLKWSLNSRFLMFTSPRVIRRLRRELRGRSPAMAGSGSA